jgi:ribosomal protein S18 acetylase RimI-like enzyme
VRQANGEIMNSDVYIKRITAYDQLEKLVGVLQTAFGTVAEKFHLTRENAPSNPAFITCAILKKSLDRGLIMFGLFLRGELIGCIGIEDSKKDNVFFIERVAVLPEHRHNGFGKKLMDFAFQMIKERNGRKISIGIIDENTVLKEWYERQGFSPVAVKQFPHLPFTVAFLEKEITQRRR